MCGLRRSGLFLAKGEQLPKVLRIVLLKLLSAHHFIHRLRTTQDTRFGTMVYTVSILQSWHSNIWSTGFWKTSLRTILTEEDQPAVDALNL